MSDRTRPASLRELILRIRAEHRAWGSLFDIPAGHFWAPRTTVTASLFSSRAGSPVGPAAGPHTQLAPNIVSAWLCGGRCIELKTVQKLDSLSIEKPCIDAADEGWNVEWSTELSLDQAFDEYLKAWMIVHVLPSLFEPLAAGADTVFTMSVGYDLAGIRSEPMDRFIDRLMDASRDRLFDRYRQELVDLGIEHWVVDGIPGQVCSSVALSTMHGCPPGEIESICAYMISEKKLDTLVKLNPTLLGFPVVQEILSAIGYGSVELSAEGFRKDLQRADAVPMLTRLLALGRNEGRYFGAKLSNTLAATNNRGVLPGAEMYMSGRALYPLTMELAASLSSEMHGSLPISFCGGAAAWNVGEILDAGVRPVTVATELLKPGGYSRLKEMALVAEGHARAWSARRVDSSRLRAAARRARETPRVRKSFRGAQKAGVDGALPLFDCFVAPCVEACPIHQDVPQYVHLSGSGRHAEALDAALRRNPLPFMTGSLCTEECARRCTRIDWEGPVRIREMKRLAAERGVSELLNTGTRAHETLLARAAKPRGVKAAVIGAGPGGLAAAVFLAREGFQTQVFERETEPGGIVRHVVPSFRIPADAVEKDVALARALGVVFHCAERQTPTVRALQARGFRWVVAAVGAEAGTGLGIPGTIDALEFLRALRGAPGSVRLGRRVAVVGGGDTAMDAARAALRVGGVESVAIVYRRTEREMPASPEEYHDAVAEGVRFHFLRAPRGLSGTEGLLCSVMAMGAPDGSGRAAPVDTGVTEVIPADTVITAVGAGVDPATLSALGLPVSAARADTQETELPGVFLVGDAASGPATIVQAIASARRAVDAICAREGGPAAPRWEVSAPDAAALRAARDRTIDPSVPGAPGAARVEASRCLGCSTLCLKCVEVCPNRANTVVRVAEHPGHGPFRDVVQIVHQDALCNECGTCATFCPWNGKPYRDKLTVFAGEKEFAESASPGFFLRGRGGLLRTGTRVTTLPAEPGDGADARALAVVDAIQGDSPWLIGGAP
jgi:putative selenate reductase